MLFEYGVLYINGGAPLGPCEYICWLAVCACAPNATTERTSDNEIDFEIDMLNSLRLVVGELRKPYGEGSPPPLGLTTLDIRDSLPGHTVEECVCGSTRPLRNEVLTPQTTEIAGPVEP